MPPDSVRPENVVGYVAFSLAFLFLTWLLINHTRPLGINLILLGIMVVMLSCGYGVIGIPTIMPFTLALSKIGFLLVLGGLACSLLVTCPNPTAAKEADHV
jgi:hypothetical protein